MENSDMALVEGPEQGLNDITGLKVYKALSEENPWDQIPTVLRELKHWVLWKAEDRDGKTTKVPYRPDGKMAASTRPGDWATFNEVREAFKSGQWSGIGFVFSEDTGICGIDLDHCINSSGEVESWAKEIIESLNSYTELSPSGKGLHILVMGKLPGGKGRKKVFKDPEHQPGAGIEIYNRGRYFTVTGKRLPNMAGEVEERQQETEELIKKYFDQPEKQPVQQSVQPIEEHNPPPQKSRLTDEQVILKAKLSNSGNKFDNLFNGSTLGYGGDDSAADMALMNMLAFWTGKDREQMERIFSMSGLGKREKWRDRPDYREMTIDRAIQDTNEVYTGRTETTDEEDILTGLSDKLKEDQRRLKDKAILKALARLQEDDPMEFDLKIKEIKSAVKGLRTETIIKMVEKAAQEEEEEPEDPEDEEIKEKAIAIATKGDPFKYLIWQAQRNHLGDIDYQKVLILSIASAASETSHGIQPGGSGEKGSGKSDACKAAYLLIPEAHKMNGSLSPMSLFYLQEAGQLKPGTVLFSDDVEYGPIIPIYKRSTGNFQMASNHYTVSSGQDRKSLKLTIPPRVVWWLTSVESVANEQAFDRQYPINTDSSLAHKGRVSREIADRRARKENLLKEDEGIRVAHAIIKDMFDNGPFQVIIPQAKRAKWLRVADFRGQEQFWDLVDALVILKWRQHKRDPDGWLIAEDRDLIEAKDIMMAHKEAHTVDLTEAEMNLVEVLLSKGGWMSQADLTEELKIAQSTVSERLKSILAKSALITEETSSGRKLYRANPKFDNIISKTRSIDLVELGIDDIEAHRGQKIALSVCYRYVIGLPIGIKINNSNRIPDSLSVNMDTFKENIFSCPLNCGYSSCEECLGFKPKKNILSIKPADKTDKALNQQQETSIGTDKSLLCAPINIENDSIRHYDTPITTPMTITGDVKETVLPLNNLNDKPALGESPPTVDSIASQVEAADDRLAEHEQHFNEKAKELSGSRIIYTPKGPAFEYSELAVNLWQGCKNGCLYCYGPTLPGMNRERYSNPTLKQDALERLEADLTRHQKLGIRKSILFMFTGDLYCPPGDDFSLSRRALELCRKYNHPFTVLTKCSIKARADFDLYGPEDSFAVTLTFLDPDKSKLWEPNADLPQDRIESLRIAHEKGIMTWVSIEPVIEPEESLAVIKAAAPYVDFFKVGKWNHDPEHRDKLIDWETFKDDVESLLKSLNKEYMIKEDLVKSSQPKSSFVRDSQGFKDFQARMNRRKCLLCDRIFPYDLTRYDVGDKHGYVCTTCLMEGPSIKENRSQMKLPISE